jgi:hypothetical protein
MARIILKRVGIAPLLALTLAVSLPAILGPAEPVQAQAATPARATATASATILPSSVRVERGVVTVRHGGATQGDQPVRPTYSERACDARGRGATEAGQSPPTTSCRMIIADMP